MRPEMIHSYDRRSKRLDTVKLERAEKQNINAELRRAGFDGRGRWKGVGYAHSAAAEVLAKFGYEFTDHLRPDHVRGDGQSLPLHISKSHPTDPFSPTPVENAMLFFSWTRLREDAYEVVAYV